MDGKNMGPLCKPLHIPNTKHTKKKGEEHDGQCSSALRLVPLRKQIFQSYG